MWKLPTVLRGPQKTIFLKILILLIFLLSIYFHYYSTSLIISFLRIESFSDEVHVFLNPWGGVGANFSLKNESTWIHLKPILLDSVFDADIEYCIRFKSKCFFTIEYELQNDQKVKNHTPHRIWSNIFHVINSFSLSKIDSFVALESSYRMVKTWTLYRLLLDNYYQNTDTYFSLIYPQMYEMHLWSVLSQIQP